ncbi:MAG: cell surface protein [Gammaproteobacteria bacterium]|nr:cell surface protein [Gammaproteobacteria bacterium]
MGNSTFNYLDKALAQIRDLGLMPAEVDEAPVVALLQKLTEVDEAKVVAIARTLSQASVFNDIVREQVSEMRVGERYEEITEAFNSIRSDAKRMVDQLDDGKVDTFERINNVWMKATRGDIASRFDKIKDTYLEVAEDSREQIERERVILEAYQDFRGAIKQSEVYALDVLALTEAEWNVAKGALQQANDTVSAFEGDDLAQRAQLELARDQRMRELQAAEDRYQVAKDISDNLTVSYNTSEVVMARLMQTNGAKERVYKQAITFFGTNESVLTALTASFTGLFGLHESTQTLEAMKEGVSKSLEDLADIGGAVQEAAVKAGYGPTIRADAVRKLVDSVVNFQERSREIIEEMRVLSTRNAEEIRETVEDGKQRMARIIERGGSLTLPHEF